MRPLLDNPLLRRYWFRTNSFTGYGVTAYSQDAEELLGRAGILPKVLAHLKEVVEDVDVSTLDQHHIRANMGPPNLRGIWYPCRNLAPND